ncbi:PAS domain-containing protein [Sphingomonas sp. BN140010]|uniref:histidine kinase n=1 Tax=Sphingomonas arvum TaxID=2992113 RepID=A0ABT3JGK6_9SPHN|nr:PAS domain-containing protein [Sphingomonas sp. BN140010]MCW3798219.1 PAS domain-containing protein [Sphingomonas sp. BN140010]
MNEQSSLAATAAKNATGQMGQEERRASFPLFFVLLLLVYALTAAAGLRWATVSGVASPIWPAAGVAFAALLLGGRRLWPAVALGFVLAAQLTGADQPLVAQAAIGLSNGLAALVAATLVRRLQPGPLALTCVREVLVLVAAAAVSSAMAATAGVGILLVRDVVPLAAAGGVLETWFFGDAVGILSVGALILSLAGLRSDALVTRRQVGLAVSLVMLAAITAAVFFGGQVPRAWLVFPILACIALLYRVPGAAAGLVIVSLVASAGTSMGHGPFVLGGPASADLVLLQQFLTVTSLTKLLLAAAVHERDSQLRLTDAIGKELSAREELQRTTSLLNVIGDAAPSLIYAKDREGRFIYANQAVLELYGCDVAELIGRTDADFAGPEDAAEFRRNDRRIMSTGKAEELEEQVTGDSGTRIFLSVKAPLRNQGGQVIGIVGTSTDVTERHQRREELVRMAQRAETAQRAARSSLYEIDVATGLISRDPLIAELCGLAPDRIVPTQHGWEQHIHPDDVPAFRNTVRVALERFERFAMEYRAVAADGRHIWLADTGQIERGADGRPTRVIGLVMDVTERKVAEEREQLLAREVDHRAKNLLAVVQSVVQLTRADDADALKDAITGRIQSLARAHSLLASSRWSGVDLMPLAHEELAPYAERDSARVTIDGPHLRLKPAAAQSLALVLHELATNAAKYGALSRIGGRVDLSWSVRDGQAILQWHEYGCPGGTPPGRAGFGSKVIRNSVERQLRGSVAYTWADDGLQVRLAIPQDHVSRLAEPDADAAGAAA